MKILIVGLTTRAVAESAVGAGVDVVTVDYFGDLDQKGVCRNISLRERRLAYGPAAFLSVAGDLAYDAVVYTGGLENAPDTVAALAAGRQLLGNDPETLRRVRDPGTVLSFLAGQGWRVPRTIPADGARPTRGTWLRKPMRGGGGLGVRRWRGGSIGSTEMLQEYVRGVPASAIFVADGRRSRILGLSEQLSGRSGFVYGGNLLPLTAPSTVRDEVDAIVAALTREFGLRGVNGLDFVLSRGRPVTLEVNPRYSASMELLERAAGVSVFRLHLDGCEGRLPATPIVPRGAWGKAIVYARAPVQVGDTRGWMARGVRDVPHPRERFERGQPICTVFASAAKPSDCRARLFAERAAMWRQCQGLAVGPPSCIPEPLRAVTRSEPPSSTESTPTTRRRSPSDSSTTPWARIRSPASATLQ